MGFRVENKIEAIHIMERFLGERVKFSGPPTFIYTIGSFTIDRNGYVDSPSDEALDEIKLMLLGDAMDYEELGRLEFEGPVMSKKDTNNLLNMLRSKQSLINKALGYEVIRITDPIEDSIGINISDGRVIITGFPAGACFEQLIRAMIDYAKKKRYICPDEIPGENEKYYMRAWLIRLGLGGTYGKEIRKVMLKNLSGHTAFRLPEGAEKWKGKHTKNIT